MKAFISGVAGFIGSNLAKYLHQFNVDIVGCDNLSGGYKDNIPVGTNFFLVDCRDPNIEKIMSGCDVVFHCAAHAYEGLSYFSPILVSESIVSATLCLLKASIHAKVRRFVYCSSMARYGNQATPFNESMPPLPIDPYGIAKVAAEEMVKSLCSFYGIEYVIVVPHNIFGVGQRYDDPYRNVIAIMVNRMLQGRPPIIYGDGTQIRSFTTIMDAIIPLANAGMKKEASGQIINIGSGPDLSISMNNLVEILNQVIGTNIAPIHIEGRPNEVVEAFCTNDKSISLLDHKATGDIRGELGRMVDWVKKRGPRPFNYDLSIEINTPRLFSAWKDRLH